MIGVLRRIGRNALFCGRCRSQVNNSICGQGALYQKPQGAFSVRLSNDSESDRGHLAVSGKMPTMPFLLKNGLLMTDEDVSKVIAMLGIEDSQKATQELLNVGLWVRVPGGYFVTGRGELWDISYTDKEQRRFAKERRRARLKGAPVIERINRNRIIERDQSICHICGQKVEKADLTLDHVIPLARGGNHTEDNLKVAHRSCNSRKGAR